LGRAGIAAIVRRPGERDQTIGATVGTPKAGKPMREHAATNESLKLTLHEQGGAALFVVYVELPEEGLEVLAYDAVQHSVLWSAPDIGLKAVGLGRGVKPHES